MSKARSSSAPIPAHIQPVIPLRDMVVFPGMVVPVLVGRPRSVRALEEAQRQDQSVVLFAQRSAEAEDPETRELYSVGVRAKILQGVKLSDGGYRLLLEASGRVRSLRFVQEEPYLAAEIEDIPEASGEEGPSLQAAHRDVLQLFEEYVRLHPKLTPDVYEAAGAIEHPGRMADAVGSNLGVKLADRQRLLEALTMPARLTILSELLSQENQILTLQRQIQGKVRKRIEKGQREAYLYEQMRAIQAELGQKGEDANEGFELRDKIKKLDMPAEAREKALKEVGRLERAQPLSAESTVIRTWLDTVLALPWGKTSKDQLDVTRAEKILEEDHAGLEKPKARILEHLAVRQLAKGEKGAILCLVGPPGVGKTSLARSIARALNRKFERISLGGVRDEAEIRGHRKTYIGSMPGRLLQSMKKANTQNPLILLDEIDKMSMDFRGDPASALLEVLDPEQNAAFTDHYLDLPFDLSKVFFITTANLLYQIPGPLRDRLEVIEVPGYLDDEKIAIATRFLIPRLLKSHGLKAGQITLNDETLSLVIREYTREAGVRELERQLAGLCRKAAKAVVEKGASAKLGVDVSNLHKYLGVPKYQKDEKERPSQVGVVNGLAWTGTGGETLSIEVTLMPGKGALQLTGTLGDVMKESAQAALSWVRAHAKDLGLAKDFHTKTDIHVHVPEGATPKDGPSAGVGMVVALASALTGRAVRGDVAMTGEVTLRGRVLPIGGLKEKSLAAHRAGIHTLIIPRQNKKDLEEIAEPVKKAVTVHLVSSVEQALKIALEPKKASAATEKKVQASVPKVERWTSTETRQ